MNRIISLFLVLTTCIYSFGQITQGGIPKSYTKTDLNEQIPLLSTPNTNIAALQSEDLVVDEIKDIPWRYGYIHYVDASFQHGVTDYLPNGDRIWRLKVKSAGAQTINLTFDNFNLKEGAQLFIYTENYINVIGSLTHQNNKDHGFLSTGLITGDEVTIELYEPQNTIGLNQLHLQRVVHGYRSLDFQKKYIGDSGNCNNNVICSVGDDWRDQIRSVGILLTQNNLSAGFCSGALINNTCEDGKAFFLTANHCGADDPTTVVGFNFESTQCNSNAGPYNNNTISGVTKRASNAGSDFMLLELSSVPPASYNVFYSGWDRTGTTTAGQVGIHHPAGDLKKISFDNQSATQSTYSGAQCWRIGDWEDGTTEGGSSGSPLFNLDGNIIGQLYGGSASCQSITNDFYGRFDISWDNGSSPADELKTWLDPCGTNQTDLSGYDPNAIVLNSDIQLGFSNAPTSEICGIKTPQVLSLRNKGIQPVTSVQIAYGLDGVYNIYNWTGNLLSGQVDQIELDSLNLLTGIYAYQAFIQSSNLVVDENPLNDAVNFNMEITNGASVLINIATNVQGGQNSFEILDADDNVIEAEGPFGFINSYSFSYCLAPGNYCVKMYDTGGNGLTALAPNGFDQGNYQLIVNGTEIVNTDAIGSLHEYCFTSEEYVSGIKAEELLLFDLFPNPNNGVFTLQSEEKMSKIELFSITGARVKEVLLNTNIFVMEVADLAKGIYFVKVNTAKGTGIKKMIVE